MLRIQEYVCPTCKTYKMLRTRYDNYQFPNKLICGTSGCLDYLLRLVCIDDTEKEYTMTYSYFEQIYVCPTCKSTKTIRSDNRTPLETFRQQLPKKLVCGVAGCMDYALKKEN